MLPRKAVPVPDICVRNAWPGHSGIEIVVPRGDRIGPHGILAKAKRTLKSDPGRVPARDRRRFVLRLTEGVVSTSIVWRRAATRCARSRHRRKPKLLLLDEPFCSLDQRLRENLRRDVVLLQNALQITMVAVTHDSADADALANRIIR